MKRNNVDAVLKNTEGENGNSTNDILAVKKLLIFSLNSSRQTLLSGPIIIESIEKFSWIN